MLLIHVLTDLKNVEKIYEIQKGISRKNDFPKDACFHMDPGFPKDIGLADHLDNEESCLVVSKQLKKFLESKITSPIEYLSVTIFNHKNQVASNEYFIVNPLNVVDCINLEESEVEWNSLDSEDIDDLEELVFDEGKIDDNMLIWDRSNRRRWLYTAVTRAAEQLIIGRYPKGGF